jgi:excisionase family DNA binding protein
MSARRPLPKRQRQPSRPASPPEPGRATVRVYEAAWLLNVSPNTVWLLIRDGELRSFKLGRSRLIARSEVDTYIERSMAAGVGPTHNAGE